MATYLADTSAWAVARRKGAPDELKTRFADLLRAGEIATCGPVKWELLHSANNAAEFKQRRTDLNALDQAPIEPSDWEQALDVCQTLAERSALHRSVRLADTIAAMAARRAGLTVLHYDEDFDRIASVTGQPTKWIAPRGSL